MTTYAVGDVQGCYDSLMKLLGKVKFDPSKDTLWSLGDLVNRGPKNYKTLKYCMNLGDSFVGVLGNHDLHLLAVALGHKPDKNNDTFHDVLEAKDLDDVITWLRHRPLVHHDPHRNMVAVHAGIPPKWSIKKTLRLAGEVETVIRDKKLSKSYFREMYGNQPDIWSKSLRGTERWRVITNYLTRMRFCDHDGRLDLKSKAGISSAPEGHHPWFQIPNRKLNETKILFGHWAALLGEADAPHVHALDTGCVWGEKLTLVDVDNLEARISVKAQEA